MLGSRVRRPVRHPLRPVLGLDAVLLTLLVVQAFGAAVVGRLGACRSPTSAPRHRRRRRPGDQVRRHRPSARRPPDQPAVHRAVRRAGRQPEGQLRRGHRRPTCAACDRPARRPRPAAPGGGRWPPTAVRRRHPPCRPAGPSCSPPPPPLAFVLIFASLVAAGRAVPPGVAVPRRVRRVRGHDPRPPAGRPASPTRWPCSWPAGDGAGRGAGRHPRHPAVGPVPGAGHLRVRRPGPEPAVHHAAWPSGATPSSPFPGPALLAGDTAFYYFVLAVVVVGAAASSRSSGSPGSGGSLRALADSPIAVQSIGVNPTASRVMVFCLSAFLAAVAGGLLGSLVQSVNPDQLRLLPVPRLGHRPGRRPAPATFGGSVAGRRPPHRRPGGVHLADRRRVAAGGLRRRRHLAGPGAQRARRLSSGCPTSPRLAGRSGWRIDRRRAAARRRRAARGVGGAELMLRLSRASGRLRPHAGCSTASTSSCPPGRRWPCSAPTAPASRRCSGWPPGCSARRPGASCSTGRAGGAPGGPRPGPARRVPHPGGPGDLPAADRRGRTWPCSVRRPGTVAGGRGHRPGRRRLPRPRRPARPGGRDAARAASSRCWPWPGPSWPTPR